jgi:Zn-dependent M28 family amino/carboxypeptidase
MVSAEELGLTGAGYFAAHPTVPAASIVANINTDMPTPIAPLLSIAPLGSQYSSILKHIEYATKILKIDIEEDPEPEQGFFMRSDQYNFVKKGIPAVYFVNGRKTNTPGFDFDAYLKQWRAKYYHKPADQIDGIFDFKALKTFVQLNFLVSYSLANDQEKPKWNEDELF